MPARLNPGTAMDRGRGGSFVSGETQAETLRRASPMAVASTFAQVAPRRWALIAFGYYFALVGVFALSIDQIVPISFP
jgi:hypothetical protein